MQNLLYFKFFSILCPKMAFICLKGLRISLPPGFTHSSQPFPELFSGSAISICTMVPQIRPAWIFGKISSRRFTPTAGLGDFLTKIGFFAENCAQYCSEAQNQQYYHLSILCAWIAIFLNGLSKYLVKMFKVHFSTLQ